MLTVDLVNTFLTLWLKPMCLLALSVSIVKSSFYFSATSSHWFLSCAFFTTLSMTILSAVFLQEIFSPIALPLVPEFFAPLFSVAPQENSVSLSVSYLLLSAYVLGVCWILSFQFFGLLEIRSISKCAHHVTSPRHIAAFESVKTIFNLDSINVTLKISRDIESPMVWGFRSPLILLPESSLKWDEARVQRVLAHELAHVSRNDWLVKIFGKFSSALFWPLPLVWVLLRKIEWFSELACDDKVIKNFDCRAEYAEDLLYVAQQKETSGWAVSFNRESQVYHRIQYILDGRNQREDIPRARKLGKFIVCIALTAPVFLFQAAPIAANQAMFISEADMTPLEQISKASREAQSYFAEDPQWPYDKEQFITILPDSPRFLEEMTVSANGYDSKDIIESSSLLGIANDGMPMLAASLPTPRLEVKGYLPRVMHTPQYPHKALRKGIEGKVIVQFDIDEAGSVVRPRVIYASPKNVFEKSVLKALMKSQFVPMQIQGRPVITKNISETFSFHLDSTSN